MYTIFTLLFNCDLSSVVTDEWEITVVFIKTIVYYCCSYLQQIHINIIAKLIIYKCIKQK